MFVDNPNRVIIPLWTEQSTFSIWLLLKEIHWSEWNGIKDPFESWLNKAVAEPYTMCRNILHHQISLTGFFQLSQPHFSNYLILYSDFCSGLRKDEQIKTVSQRFSFSTGVCRSKRVIVVMVSSLYFLFNFFLLLFLLYCHQFNLKNVPLLLCDSLSHLY